MCKSWVHKIEAATPAAHKPKREGPFRVDAVLILCRCCADLVSILCQFCSRLCANSVRIMCRFLCHYVPNCVCAPCRFGAHSVSMMCQLGADSAPILPKTVCQPDCLPIMCESCVRSCAACAQNLPQNLAHNRNTFDTEVVTQDRQTILHRICTRNVAHNRNGTGTEFPQQRHRTSTDMADMMHNFAQNRHTRGTHIEHRISTDSTRDWHSLDTECAHNRHIRDT